MHMTEMPASDGLVRPMADTDLERVLVWRNHPDIRRCMLTQHRISPDEHRRWFERTGRDPDRHLLLFEIAETPLGFVHFTGKLSAGFADWGFYTDPKAPRGTGRKLGKAALHYAFDRVGFHKVCGQALDFNGASIRLHRALGFRQEGVLRQQYCIDNVYHDLICFGLLRSEWIVQPEGD